MPDTPIPLKPEAEAALHRLEEALGGLPAPEAFAASFRALEALLRVIERLPLVPGEAPRALSVAAARQVGEPVLRLLRAAPASLDRGQWRALLPFRRVLSDLFAAGDAMPGGRWAARGMPPAAQDTVYGLELAVAPLESVPRLAGALAALPAEDRMNVAVSWLADPVVVSAAQAAGRDWLIAHTDLLQADRIPIRMAARMASAWMFCSYADSPDRHAVKRALNKTIARGLNAAGIRPPAPASTVRSARGERPVIFVVAERFQRYHAMFRCYAPSIAQLRARCRVVVLGQQAHLDDGATELADEVWTVPEALGELPALVRRITEAQPDAIFFPSVGMSFWSIALANLRLAPLQFMSIGHPASSFSEHMDCMVLGGDVLGDPACFSETVVVRDAPGNPIHPPRDAWGPAPAPRAHPDVLEVAVPAMAAKISPAFVGLCLRLAREAARPMRFHFFPNRPGLGTRSIEAALLREFAAESARGTQVSLIVRPTTSYTRYMNWLAQCDFALATFPFGNANSTVDCLLLGKPVVALEGDEPAARTDRRMLRLAGAPEWLLSNTREGWFQAALRLARDDALRVETARAILASDPERALFERERERHPDDFADVVAWMLDNIDLIRSGARKVWWPADRRAATAPLE